MIHQHDIELFRRAFQEIDSIKLNRHTLKSLASTHEAPEGINEAMESERQRRSTHFRLMAQVTAAKQVRLQQALHGLRRVGCSSTLDMKLKTFFPADQVMTDEIDFYGFCQAAMCARRDGRAAFRENGGFTEDEVKELWNKFNTYDGDQSGQISGMETIKLMEQEFPSISNDPKRRPQVIQLIKESDEDGSGSLDFKDFLRMMRQLHDMQDQLRIGKELEAVSETKFTPVEVADFRELFLAAGDGIKELGFAEIKSLLMCVVPMGTKNVEELKHMFEEFAAKQNGVAGDAALLDFPEFLWLMRQLIDMNFANMTDRANSIAQG
jgi:Ca2+-binding EF-hand superfamily protein